MSYETLLVEKKDKIAIVTINRPDVLNALNNQVLGELDAAFSDAAPKKGRRPLGCQRT